PFNTARPTISGQPHEGQRLQAADGTWWGPVSATSYQWQSCDAQGQSCANVSGQTNSYYDVANGDTGKTLKVVVTKTGPAGSASASSQPTTVVQGDPPTATTNPAISGGSTPPIE